MDYIDIGDTTKYARREHRQSNNGEYIGLLSPEQRLAYWEGKGKKEYATKRKVENDRSGKL